MMYPPAILLRLRAPPVKKNIYVDIRHTEAYSADMKATPQQIRKQLAQRVRLEGLGATAKALDLTPTYIRCIASGVYPVSAKVAAKLGYPVARVTYSDR